MPTTNCLDCGNSVSTEAVACPKCGRPNTPPLAYLSPLPVTPKRKLGALPMALIAVGCVAAVVVLKIWSESDPEGTGGAALGLVAALIPLVLLIVGAYWLKDIVRGGVSQGIDDSKRPK